MWGVVVIGVVLAVAIVGWLWWTKTRGSDMAKPAARRATDAEIASTMEPDAVPMIPPPSGAGVPMVPIVPTLVPDDTFDDERGGPLPDEPGGASVEGDDESAEN